MSENPTSNAPQRANLSALLRVGLALVVVLVLAACTNPTTSPEWAELEARHAQAREDILEMRAEAEDLLDELHVESIDDAHLRRDLLAQIDELERLEEETERRLTNDSRYLEPAKVELRRLEGLLDRLRSGDF